LDYSKYQCLLRSLERISNNGMCWTIKKEEKSSTRCEDILVCKMRRYIGLQQKANRTFFRQMHTEGQLSVSFN